MPVRPRRVWFAAALVNLALATGAAACANLSGLSGGGAGEDAGSDVTSTTDDAEPVAPPAQADGGDCVRFEGVCEGSRAVRLSASEGLACAVLASGTVYCWGKNSEGQGGSPPTAAGVRLAPTKVAGLDRAVDVATARSFACALRDDETVWCWGSNGRGQLGHEPGTEGDVTCNVGSPTSAACNPTPTRVKGLLPATSLALGYEFACAVTVNGQVSCWGDAKSQQLGLSSAVAADAGFSPAPVVATGNVAVDAGPSGRTLCAGSEFACVLEPSGSVKCWGNNLYGQLGGASKGGSSATPSYVLSALDAGAPRLEGMETVACSVLEGFASSTAAGVTGWWPPLHEPGSDGYVQLTVGDTQVCGRRANGEISCWGRNTGGELGIPDAAIGFGENAKYAAGTVVFDGVAVAAGFRYTLAVGQDGGVWGWGEGASVLPFDGGRSSTPRRLEGLP